jgi:hypothetical protein
VVVLMTAPTQVWMFLGMQHLSQFGALLIIETEITGTL